MLGWLESKLVYQPRAFPDLEWNPPGLSIDDIYVTTEDGVRLHGWLARCPADAPAARQWRTPPVMLWCHGNAGNITHRAEYLRRWMRHVGADVLLFDYRGYGRSEGSPNERGFQRDARCMFDWLTNHAGAAANHVFVRGRSMGGAVALDLALSRPVRALMLESAFTSMPDVVRHLHPWLPAHWLMRTRMNNLARVKHYTGSLLVAHGGADGLVPVSHGRALHAAANEPKHYFEAASAGHNDIAVVAEEDYFTAINGFLRSAMPDLAAGGDA